MTEFLKSTAEKILNYAKAHKKSSFFTLGVITLTILWKKTKLFDFQE
jgi:hypothetical protein